MQVPEFAVEYRRPAVGLAVKRGYLHGYFVPAPDSLLYGFSFSCRLAVLRPFILEGHVLTVRIASCNIHAQGVSGSEDLRQEPDLCYHRRTVFDYYAVGKYFTALI